MITKDNQERFIDFYLTGRLNLPELDIIEKKIKNDGVTINYFSHTEKNIQPDVQPISITDKGELSDWPSGFFDQTQIDFAELFNLRKG